MTPLKKGAIYCRVSSEEQELHGTSLENQEIVNKTFAKENGIHVPEEFIFSESYSGGFLERPQIMEVLELVENKKIDVLIITKRDRFARDSYVFHTIMKALKDNDVEVLYSEEKLTGDRAMDDFMGNTIMGFAQWEREQIKIRTNAGKRRHSEKNMWVWSHIPFGYTKNPKTKELEINEEEAKIVTRIVNLYIEEGYTLERIAELMTKEKILPPGLYRKTQEELLEVKRKNDLYFWHFSAVKRLLANANLYAGTYLAFTKQYKKIGKKSILLGMRPREEWIEVQVPSLITKEQAKQIFEQFDKNQRYAKKNNKNIYALQGKLYCDCEPKLHNFTGYFHNPKQKRNYRCSLNNRSKTSKERLCKNHVSGMKIEKIVFDTLYEMFTDPRYIHELTILHSNKAKGINENNIDKDTSKGNLNEKNKENTKETRIDKLFKQLESIELKYNRNHELYLEGGITKERFYEAKDKLDNEKKEFELEIKKEKSIQKSSNLSNGAIQNIENLYEIYEMEIEEFFMTATYKELKELVNLVVDKIIVPSDKDNPVKLIMKLPGHPLSFEEMYSKNYGELYDGKNYFEYEAQPKHLKLDDIASPYKERVVTLNKGVITKESLKEAERKAGLRFIDILKGKYREFVRSDQMEQVNIFDKLKEWFFCNESHFFLSTKSWTQIK